MGRVAARSLTGSPAHDILRAVLEGVPPPTKEHPHVDDVFDRVKTIIVEQLGVDEDKVTMDASFRKDLEADSLDLVELIMAFEDEFGEEISDEDAQRIETVRDAVAYLKEN